MSSKQPCKRGNTLRRLHDGNQLVSVMRKILGTYDSTDKFTKVPQENFVHLEDIHFATSKPRPDYIPTINRVRLSRRAILLAAIMALSARSSSDTTTTSGNIPSLGLLAKLPVEIRSLVWEYLLPDYGIHPPMKEGEKLLTWHTHSKTRTPFWDPVHKLEIARAHPLLYSEISPRLGQRGVLYASINIDSVAWSFMGEPRFQGREYYRLIAEGSHTVFITIFAPDRRDPGQMVALREKITQVVLSLTGSGYLLSGCGDPYSPNYQVRLNKREEERRRDPNSEVRPKRLELRFSDHGMCSWVDEAPTCSSCTTWGMSNLMLALSVFKYFHILKGTEVNVILPSSAEGVEDVRKLASDIVQSTMVPCWDFDNGIIIEQTKAALKLDITLDEMPGPTAAFLRQQRFRRANFYSHEWTIKYLIETICRLSKPTEDLSWATAPLELRRQIKAGLIPLHGK